MKLQTEWKLGNLALVINMFCVMLWAILVIIPIHDYVNYPLLVGLLVLMYSISIMFIFNCWVDKFKYLED